MLATTLQIPGATASHSSRVSLPNAAQGPARPLRERRYMLTPLSARASCTVLHGLIIAHVACIPRNALS